MRTLYRDWKKQQEAAASNIPPTTNPIAVANNTSTTTAVSNTNVINNAAAAVTNFRRNNITIVFRPSAQQPPPNSADLPLQASSAASVHSNTSGNEDALGPLQPINVVHVGAPPASSATGDMNGNAAINGPNNNNNSSSSSSSGSDSGDNSSMSSSSSNSSSSSSSDSSSSSSSSSDSSSSSSSDSDDDRANRIKPAGKKAAARKKPSTKKSRNNAADRATGNSDDDDDAADPDAAEKKREGNNNKAAAKPGPKNAKGKQLPPWPALLPQHFNPLRRFPVEYIARVAGFRVTIKIGPRGLLFISGVMASELDSDLRTDSNDHIRNHFSSEILGAEMIPMYESIVAAAQHQEAAYDSTKFATRGRVKAIVIKSGGTSTSGVATLNGLQYVSTAFIERVNSKGGSAQNGVVMTYSSMAQEGTLRNKYSLCCVFFTLRGAAAKCFSVAAEQALQKLFVVEDGGGCSANVTSDNKNCVLILYAWIILIDVSSNKAAKDEITDFLKITNMADEPFARNLKADFGKDDFLTKRIITGIPPPPHVVAQPLKIVESWTAGQMAELNHSHNPLYGAAADKYSREAARRLEQVLHPLAVKLRRNSDIASISSSSFYTFMRVCCGSAMPFLVFKTGKMGFDDGGYDRITDSKNGKNGATYEECRVEFGPRFRLVFLSVFEDETATNLADVAASMFEQRTQEVTHMPDERSGFVSANRTSAVYAVLFRPRYGQTDHDARAELEAALKQGEFRNDPKDEKHAGRYHQLPAFRDLPTSKQEVEHRVAELKRQEQQQRAGEKSAGERRKREG